MINVPSSWTDISPSVPFIGAWKKKVTYIEKMWAQPCGVSPLMIVAGAFAASPVLLSAIFEPDCLDHTYDRVGRPHRKMRRLSANISDYTKPLNAPLGGVGNALWSGAALAQRIGFYSLLVDASLDWVIYGTSFAWQWSGCDDPNQGFSSLAFENTTVALLPAQTFTLNVWIEIDGHIFSGGPTGIATPAGHAVGCGFGLTQHTSLFLPLPDASWTAHLFDTVSLYRSHDQTPSPDSEGNPYVAFSPENTGAANTSHFYQVRITKTFGALNMSGHMSAGGANLTAFKPTACGHSLKGFD